MVLSLPNVKIRMIDYPISLETVLLLDTIKKRITVLDEDLTDCIRSAKRL
jgi:hypothetical protein